MGVLYVGIVQSHLAGPLQLIIIPEPADKLGDPVLVVGLWAVSGQRLQQICIGPSGRDVAGLHGHEIAFGGYTGCVFDGGDEIHQMDGV